MKRSYKRLNKYFDKIKKWNNDTNNDIMEILFRIHNHYCHTYDIGYRLNQNEKHIIFQQQLQEEQKNDDDFAITDTITIHEM